MAKEIRLTELLALLEAGPKIIDIRKKELFVDPLPGAVNIPYLDLVKAPQNYLNFTETYYLICQDGGLSHYIGLSLQGKGYEVIHVCDGYEGRAPYRPCPHRKNN